MDEKERKLRGLVNDSCVRLSDGISLENPKLEFKREWPKLRGISNEEQTRNESEFLKDMVAMVNTPGPVGYLIIGIDSKGVLHDAPLNLSGLADPSDLRGLVVKRVDKPFLLELYPLRFASGDHTLEISILEVPPSYEKPHVIRRHVSSRGYEIQNFIPVRKTGGIFPAGKYDIDNMVWDNKNIQPFYALTILQYNEKVIVIGMNQRLQIDVTLALQNFGSKPVGITGGSLNIEPEYLGAITDLDLQLLTYDEDLGIAISTYRPDTRCLVVPSNAIKPVRLRFQSVKTYNASDHRQVDRTLRGLKELHYHISLVALDSYVATSDRLLGRQA